MLDYPQKQVSPLLALFKQAHPITMLVLSVPPPSQLIEFFSILPLLSETTSSSLPHNNKSKAHHFIWTNSSSSRLSFFHLLNSHLIWKLYIIGFSEDPQVDMGVLPFALLFYCPLMPVPPSASHYCRLVVVPFTICPNPLLCPPFCYNPQMHINLFSPARLDSESFLASTGPSPPPNSFLFKKSTETSNHPPDHRPCLLTFSFCF